MSSQVELSNASDILLWNFCDRSHEGHPGSPQGIAADHGGRHQQARALVAQEILRMHGHCADEKNWATLVVQGIGHHLADGPTRLLARERRKAPLPFQMNQRPGPLGMGRFGNGRSVGVRPAVMLSR